MVKRETLSAARDVTGMLRLLVYCRERASARLRANNRWSIGARCRTRRSAQLGLARQVVDRESRRLTAERVTRGGFIDGMSRARHSERAPIVCTRSRGSDARRFSRQNAVHSLCSLHDTRVPQEPTWAWKGLDCGSSDRRWGVGATRAARSPSAVLIISPGTPEPAGDHSTRPIARSCGDGLSTSWTIVLVIGASQHPKATRTTAPH